MSRPSNNLCLRVPVALAPEDLERLSAALARAGVPDASRSSFIRAALRRRLAELEAGDSTNREDK